MPIPLIVKTIASGAIVAAPIIIDAAKNAHKIVADRQQMKAETQKDYIHISNGVGSNVDMYVEHLKKKGLDVNLIPAEPRIKYRYYKENLVVRTEPSGDKAVPPNSFIKVWYLTSEVIEESNKIYDDLMAVRKKRINDIKNLVTKKKK